MRGTGQSDGSASEPLVGGGNENHHREFFTECFQTCEKILRSKNFITSQIYERPSQDALSVGEEMATVIVNWFLEEYKPVEEEHQIFDWEFSDSEPMDIEECGVDEESLLDSDHEECNEHPAEPSSQTSTPSEEFSSQQSSSQQSSQEFYKPELRQRSRSISLDEKIKAVALRREHKGWSLKNPSTKRSAASE
ncbi:hypothetical protein QAD02_005750 [Eretmocerus hayati]|uniref:Uncharacterized protein n=1 Tax=Eretmocerus hayati TaxID=131215 RepID=A0ACC2NUC9_9HYME|nr:hypothetical protein QAD02_005750 [Eretmocerus hayati]